MALNSVYKKLTLFFVILAGALFFSFVLGAKVEALPGVRSNVYPDYNPDPNIKDGTAVVQIVDTRESNYYTKMKGQTMTAGIYVPSYLWNQNITLTIMGGCDNDSIFGRDSNGGSGETYFAVSTLPTKLNDSNCVNGNVYYDFTADPNLRNTIKVYETNTTYAVFSFVAYAWGSEQSPRYLNAFQIYSSPGTLMGTALKPVACMNSYFPNSCPETTLPPPTGLPGGVSWAYSSFYGSSDPSTIRTEFSLGCGGGKAELLVYDLDGGDASLGQTLTIKLFREGVHVYTLDNQTIINNGGTNNSVLHLPHNGSPFGYPWFTMEPNVKYELELSGLSKDNAFQFLSQVVPNKPTGNCGDEGDRITCTISYIRRSSDGSTTINPGDYVHFDVTVKNADGYKIGVNGPDWGAEYPGTDIANYLVAGSQYIRGSPWGSPWGSIEFQGNQQQTKSIDDIVRQSEDWWPNEGMQAPAAGVYAFNWGLVLPGFFWAPVTCAASLTVTPAGIPDHATCVSATSNKYWMTPGESYQVVITMNNAGSWSWGVNQVSLGSYEGYTDNYYTNGGGGAYLGVNVGDGDWTDGYYMYPAQDIPPTWNAAFVFNLTAPATPGNYNVNFKMVRWYYYWFGEQCGVNINVYQPAFDDATCTVSLTNVAGTKYPNSEYLATFTIKNTGNTTWQPGTWDLATHSSVTNNYLTNSGGPSVVKRLPGPIYPGQTVTLTHQAPIPGGPSYGNTYPFNWMMVHWGVAWFGQQCVMSITGVSGRVADAFNQNIPRNSVINTCGWGNIESNGAVNGSFSFAVQQGQGFCVEAISVTPSPDNVYVRPWGEGYRVCPAYGYSDSATTLKCYSSTFYGSQAYNAYGQIVTVPDQYAGTARNDGYDRAQDWGYDLAPAWKPRVRCTIQPQAGIEVGVSYTPKINVFNNMAPDVSAGTAPAITGSVSHFVNGVRSDGAINPALATGSSRTIDTSPQVAFSSPTTYPATASTAWVGGPWSEAVNCPNDSVGASELPYLKFYGGDVWAGGSFGSTASCPADNSGIYAFAKGSGRSYQGSSGQFGVTAIKSIDQFFSASNKISSNQPPKDLTQANTNAADVYGGNYGGDGLCITDFFNKTRLNPANTGNITSAISSAGNGKSQFVANGDNYSGQAIPKGKQIAVYITGNVFIDKDIKYDTSARSSVEDIPYFALVVLGNIYIGPGVSQLDGLYVTQPSGANTDDGKIYTCAPSAGNTYTPGQLYANCKRQLSINGALVARQVKFLRAINSLKDSTVNNNGAQGEIPNFADGSGNGNGANTKAAEIINYTPEFYLAPSPFHDPADPGEPVFDRYDAITTLPPVF